MTILYFTLAFTACVATAGGGAWGMRTYIQRTREIPEHDDPRDANIRHLHATLKLARKEIDHYRSESATAEKQLRLGYEQIAELSNQSASAMQQYQTCKQVLKDEIGRKNTLREQLSCAEEKLSALGSPVTDSESGGQSTSGERFGPHPAAVIEKADNFDSLNTPSIDGANPSLLQSLTEDMERWRHHCHVLGTELRHQRELLSRRNMSINGDKSSRDKLTTIHGIGPVLERKLHDLGIYRYRDLAELSIEDLKKASRLIPDLKGRMRRDAWAEQARQMHLAKYQDQI
jgi:hypothetical protein